MTAARLLLLRALAFSALPAFSAWAQTFTLPTPNRAVLEKGAEERAFVPTPGRTWLSGTFGCVRTDGWQMHEGLDIKCVQRNAKGEPADPVAAAAAGRVAYVNEKAGLSNYGRYIVLQHVIEGLAVFTTYAHLSAIAPGLNAGDAVRQGQLIGTMGRSSNTGQGISKERAHLHFEIGFRLNDRFAAWHAEKLPGQRNDHGNWNGKNFIGIDPRQVFFEQQRLGAKFSLLEFARGRTELCRVAVRDTSFAWLKACTPLIRRNAAADREGVAGYEIALDFNGLPFLLIPRTRAELGAGPRIKLLSVNEREQAARPCRKIVVKRSGNWELGATGSQLFDLLAY